MSIDHTHLTKLFLEDNFIISDHARVKSLKSIPIMNNVSRLCFGVCGRDSISCRDGAVQRSCKSR